MIAGGVGAAPVPSHASAARSARAKPQSHWGRTRARRTPGPGTPARAPATRGRTAGGSRATSRSRSDGEVAGRAAPGPRARPARALRERRGHDLPRPRAALGQDHDFAYPMYPSRHFHPVREYQYTVILIQCFGLKCRNPADGRSGRVYRTDRNGSIASGGPRSDPTGQGRTPPDAGQRPGRGRPGRLPAGKPGPRCMRRRRTGSRARCGGCSPMIGRAAATARVRRRGGRSDTKERRCAERLRKARRRVMANRSDRDRPDPITHEAQLGAAVFPGARASGSRAHSWTGHAPVDFTSLGSAAGSAGCAMARWSRRHEALAGWNPALPGSRALEKPLVPTLGVVRSQDQEWIWLAQVVGPSARAVRLHGPPSTPYWGGMSEGARLLAIDKEAWASGGTAWLPEMARQDASAPIARPARCPSTTATSMSRGW